jgi:hypothetical protein
MRKWEETEAKHTSATVNKMSWQGWWVCWRQRKNGIGWVGICRWIQTTWGVEEQVRLEFDNEKAVRVTIRLD